MKIIVCLDNDNGMLFNGRRQSSDVALLDRLRQIIGTQTLWMNAYSAGLLANISENTVVVENFLDKALDDDFCFIENADISSYAAKVNTVIIYRWNRNYPQDVSFPVSLFSDKWRLISTHDFVGHSHQRISEEVYYL